MISMPWVTGENIVYIEKKMVFCDNSYAADFKGNAVG